MKIATSGSLDGIQKLIAEFYATTPERIVLKEAATDLWEVFTAAGEKRVAPVVTRSGRRFVFSLKTG